MILLTILLCPSAKTIEDKYKKKETTLTICEDLKTAVKKNLKWKKPFALVEKKPKITTSFKSANPSPIENIPS
jgi:hypothetical protein